MDGATMFVIALAALFFGFVAFLAVYSRRNERINAEDQEKRPFNRAS